MTAQNKTAWRPARAAGMGLELGPSVAGRVVLPELPVVEGAVVVPVPAQDVAFSIDGKLRTRHPGLTGKVVERGPAVRGRIVGVEVAVDRQRSVLRVPMAHAHVGDAIDAEVKRVVPVTRGERGQFRPAVRGDVVPPPIAEVAVVRIAPQPDENLTCRQHHGGVIAAVAREGRQFRPRPRRHVEVPEVGRIPIVIGPEADVGVVSLAHAVAVAAASTWESAEFLPRVRGRVIPVHVVQIQRSEARLTRQHIGVLVIGHRDGMVAAIARRRRELNPILGWTQEGAHQEGQQGGESNHGCRAPQNNPSNPFRLRPGKIFCPRQ